MYYILGEYKTPNFKPFEKINPQEEVKALWEVIKKDNETKGIKEVGDGSTCFEHCFEFWGTWKVNPEQNEQFLKDCKNWPKGIKIIEVEPK